MALTEARFLPGKNGIWEAGLQKQALRRLPEYSLHVLIIDSSWLFEH